MRFRLTFLPTADRSFAALPRQIQFRFDRAFAGLEGDPRQGAGRLDVHPLYGYQSVWTLRIPPFRGIYAIDGSDIVIVVFGHRDTVYSLLHHLIPPGRQTVTKAALRRRR
jgi:mRNA-degrading endonuclease RelE of RelBE toxin-antitoxin system